MRVLGLVCACALAALAGCSSVSSRPAIEGIVYGTQPYDDLPVPTGFTFDDSDRSWAYTLYENSPLNLRSCVLRYEGDRDVGQLMNWYAGQMPEHGWQKISETKEEDGRRVTLVYKRESEEAIIDIVREIGLRRAEPYTVLTLRLGVAPVAAVSGTESAGESEGPGERSADAK